MDETEMQIVDTPMLDHDLLIEIEETGVDRDSDEAESYAQFLWQPGTRWLLCRKGWRQATSDEMQMIRGWCSSLGRHAPAKWNEDPDPQLEDEDVDGA